jgi:hypothetical protein
MPQEKTGDVIKAKEPSLETIGKRIDKVTKKESINVEKLVTEAVEWARKSK